LKNKKYLAQILLVFVTLIWGATFIMVKDALNDAGPFAFGTLRFTIAGILTLVIVNKSIFTLTKTEIIGGLICGFCLFCGYAFQNFGLMQTSASKSAFITSVSVLMVPIILYLFNIQKIKMKVWFAVVLATIGLYFLLDPRGGMMNWGDILTFGCALGFAVHIIFQGYYVKKNVRVLPFFLVQAWVVVGLSFINSLLFEPIFAIWSPRLISALLVTGIAATFIAILLMIWAQQILNPSETAIIFSLEPVFATVFAIIFAGEILGLWGYIGGGLIVLAVAYGESG
jgi:drug/metabolite transporter (DMT)-like permease|tara:strand:- start:167 stop:1018 length:852 start_codon:yes stop_codon:yes gene_type:complete